jgi:hypothetical protein
VNWNDRLGLISSVDDLVSKIGKYDTNGDSCCEMSWCEAFAKFIEFLADECEDYDTFQEYFHWDDYGRKGAEALAPRLNNEVNCESKQFAGASTRCRDCVGLKDEFLANGNGAGRHFAGALWWGSLAARAQSKILDDGLEQIGNKKGTPGYEENKAEAAANIAGAKASVAIEKELGKHAPWYVEDEESDEAWKAAKGEVAKQWRTRFCR